MRELFKVLQPPDKPPICASKGLARMGTESLRPRTKSSAWWVLSQRPSCPEAEKLEGLYPFSKNLKVTCAKKINQQSDVNSWEQYKIWGKKDCEAKSRLIYPMLNRWPSPPLWLTDHDSVGALHFPAICACKTNQTLTMHWQLHPLSAF